MDPQISAAGIGALGAIMVAYRGLDKLGGVEGLGRESGVLTDMRRGKYRPVVLAIAHRIQRRATPAAGPVGKPQISCAIAAVMYSEHRGCPVPLQATRKTPSSGGK